MSVSTPMSADEIEPQDDVHSDTEHPDGRSDGTEAAVATEEPAVPFPEPPPAPPQVEDPGFDLKGVENPSFAVLEEGQSLAYQTSARVRGFEKQVDALGDTGEEGRRKGLGYWILGRYDRCVEQLASYEQDDVAAYTRGQALMSTSRYDEAAPIFKRLSDAYPQEPRPRGCYLLAVLESDLQKLGDEDPGPAIARVETELDGAPDTFHESVEGSYLAGRLAELRRDFEGALDHYAAGFEADPTHRENGFHGALLAERCGLDEEAIAYYETLVQLRPVDRRVLMNLGVLYEDAGRDQDAAACYDIVVNNDPTNKRARLYLQDARAGIDMYYDEDLERKEDRLNQILRIPITDFELSVRARNCLNKMQIQTLGDLVCRTEQELLSYKNFGETSLTEIKEILHSKGLRLGMPREEAVASIEAHSRRPQTGEQADVMNKPIMELQLSIRARRTVEALGCLTAGDVTKHSAEELLGMPNFGQTSLQELRSTLADLNLKLKGE